MGVSLPFDFFIWCRFHGWVQTVKIHRAAHFLIFFSMCILLHYEAKSRLLLPAPLCSSPPSSSFPSSSPRTSSRPGGGAPPAGCAPAALRGAGGGGRAVLAGAPPLPSPDRADPAPRPSAILGVLEATAGSLTGADPVTPTRSPALVTPGTCCHPLNPPYPLGLLSLPELCPFHVSTRD